MKVFTDKRGVEFKFEAAQIAGNYNCSLERHNLSVDITYQERGSEDIFYIRHKTKRQRHKRSAGSSSDFQKVVNLIERTFNSHHKREVRDDEAKVKNKEQKGEFLNSLKPRLILCSSRGYSMTIVDFWRITKIKGSKVTLVELNNKYPDNDNGSLSGSKVVPGEVSTRSEPKEYTVRGSRLKINDSSSASIWDGLPKYENRND